jgi:hypothetical protein
MVALAPALLTAGKAAMTFASSGGGQLLMAGISAAGQMSAGRSQQRGYDAQALQAEIRGRSEAIAYKQKGADALRNLNETLAAIISRSAAGGVDPTSGSASTLQGYAMSEGVREQSIAADNAVLALGQAQSQAGIYRSAGRSAMLSSYVSAAGSLGQGAYRYGQLR